MKNDAILGHFLPGSHCELVVHSSISQLPLRPERDPQCGPGMAEVPREGTQKAVRSGLGAGHPIATIYFPSAARNTSGQEEREGKKERAAVDRELINDIRRGKRERLDPSIELCAHLTSFYNCRLRRCHRRERADRGPLLLQFCHRRDACVERNFIQRENLPLVRIASLETCPVFDWKSRAVTVFQGMNSTHCVFEARLGIAWIHPRQTIYTTGLF